MGPHIQLKLQVLMKDLETGKLKVTGASEGQGHGRWTNSLTLEESKGTSVQQPPLRSTLRSTGDISGSPSLRPVEPSTLASLVLGSETFTIKAESVRASKNGDSPA